MAGFIELVSDIRKTEKRLQAINKQIPFATSRALNGVTFDTQKYIREVELPRRFILRNRFTQRSIRVKLSRKTDLKSEVYSDAYYLEGQTAGKVRTPKGDAFAVPISKQWKNKRKRIPKRIRPDVIMGGTKGFIGKTKSGEPAIVMRTKRKRKPTLVTMYSLQPSVRIRKRMDLDGIVNAVVPARYPVQFERELTNALKTAK